MKMTIGIFISLLHFDQHMSALWLGPEDYKIGIMARTNRKEAQYAKAEEERRRCTNMVVGIYSK
jgi:hypothetical protein